MSLLSRLENQWQQEEKHKGDDSGWIKSSLKNLDGIKEKAHRILLEEWDKLPFVKGSSVLSEADLKRKLESLIEKVLEEEKKALPRKDTARLVDELMDDILGLGPITDFVEDPTINEIMVNGPGRVYVERSGKLELTEVTFRNDAHVMQIIDRIVSPLGRHVDEACPMVDARLPDGSRVNAIIPPLSLIGPVLTIRKFSKEPYTINDLVSFGTLNVKMACFLQACVEARLNIVISGGSGSGKTTTLNVLSAFIPADERIITIEDAAELQLKQEHVVTLETRPPNIEGKGGIFQRELVQNSLRMRPDRIIVGEVRGGEALDMLQAMNTGHDGSLTTCHSNSPRDTLARLETMVLMAGMDLPVRAIREQIASAIDLIIHQERLRDGTRRITSITEVSGIEGNVITLQDIFLFIKRGRNQQGKVIGEFAYTGLKPKFTEKFEQHGITLPLDIFGEAKR